MSLRALKIVCAISVMLNLFLLGASIGGAAWVHARRPMIGGSIRLAGAELPRDKRRVFRRALRDARLEIQPTIAAGRRARQDAAALLRAPTLDQAALEAALARARVADFAVRAHVETRAVAVAATLAPIDRATLADGIVRKRAASDGTAAAMRSKPVLGSGR